jgi:hypothetical protein
VPKPRNHPGVEYVGHGLALVSIPHATKGPRGKGWNRRENAITTPQAAARLNGHNIGLLHEFSGTCAVDVDDLKRARTFLAKEGVDLSGLLDARDAVQIDSGRPNRAKLIYRLPPKVAPLPHRKLADGALELRCAGVQDVLPPSVHPDTGRPYRWRGDWRKLPELPKQLLALWKRDEPSKPTEDKDILREGARNAGLASLAGSMRRRGMSARSIKAALLAENAERCDPPLATDEVRRIARSVARYAPETRARVSMRRVADIEPRPIDWLWPDRIARGKVTILAGHPGLGKSQLALSIAAIVSRGDRWPASSTPAERGVVVILSAEDAADDTIRPRLEAAGGDLSRIHVIDAVRTDKGDVPFDLGRDLSALDASLDELSDVALLVIDPITAYLGTTDSHKNAEVRALLAPLSKLAEKRNIAILCVTHLNKGAAGQSGALMRVMGSLAFVAASRAAYVVVRDPEDHGRRLFLPAKNNLGTDETGFAFRIEPRKVRDDIATSRVAWESQGIEASVDEMLDAPTTPKRRDAAIEFLRELLRDKPLPTEQIRAEAEAAGFVWKTVTRAKARLGVQALKHRGRRGGWSWMLPNSANKEGQNRLVKNVVPVVPVVPLTKKDKKDNKDKRDNKELKDDVVRVTRAARVKFPPSRRAKRQAPPRVKSPWGPNRT